MRRVTFYRCALFLPVAIPAILWAFGRQLSRRDTDTELAAFFMYSLPSAGMPYILFALGLAWWMQGKAPNVLRQATLWAPMLFVPCAWLGIVAQSALLHDPAGTGGVGGSLMIALGVLLVGYTYVGVVEAARWYGERIGLLSKPQPA